GERAHQEQGRVEAAAGLDRLRQRLQRPAGVPSVVRAELERGDELGQQQLVHRGVLAGPSAGPDIYYPPLSGSVRAVPHSPEEKKKVLARIRRIRGQCEGLERALEAGADCAPVLQQIAAIRGAVNGLMSEVLESHLREQFGHPAADQADREARVAEMTGLIR